LLPSREVCAANIFQRSTADACSAWSGTLPSFFIIGPPRTGTTWLHTVLSRRTVLPWIKETRFFDLQFDRGIGWYRRCFRSGNGLRIGEIAPTYFCSTLARERIARAIPSARVVCTFRNPIERLISLYRVKRAYGWIRWTLEEAISRDPELIESGKYASNLKAWQMALGKDQILSTIYDDLQQNAQRFVDAIADFISIPRFGLSAMEMRTVFSSNTLTEPRSYYRTRGAMLLANWCKMRNLGAIPDAVKTSPYLRYFVGGGPKFVGASPELLNHLSEIFRPEIDELEVLLERDLISWKTVTSY
jgi:hypothetical protein